MTPKNSGLNTGCVNASSSNCVTWEGPSIPCIDLCHGQSVSTVIAAIGTKICDLVGDMDFTTLDISCLIDSVEPADRNLSTILQLILDNQCSLKELIDDIEGGNTETTLNLNLKCLKKFDEFENEIPQDLNQTLQSIVNQVCTNKDDIANLKADVLDIQEQIDAIETVDPYEEPEIITCVNGAAKPVSEVVPILATDYCTFKTKMGSTADIANAIARQCPDLATSMMATPGWVITPANISQTVNNIWLALCDALNRITVMEQTCCAPNCDKIKLGFEPTFDFEAKTVVLAFTSGAGTVLPGNFEDCGTVLTVTDRNKFSKTFTALDISLAGETTLNLNGLAQGMLTFSFKTKFCLKDANDAVILTCQDCVGQEVEYFDSTCCTLTNTGTTAVTIVYETCSNNG